MNILGSSVAVMDLSVGICSSVYKVVQKKPDISAEIVHTIVIHLDL